MKNIAFVVGLLILGFGAFGVILPSGLVVIALQSVTPSVFYIVAVVRIAFGLVLISVASASRSPKTVRVLGYFILLAGAVTALTGLLAIERAHVIIDWWVQQGAAVIRITSMFVMALGGFVAYACAPVIAPHNRIG